MNGNNRLTDWTNRNSLLYSKMYVNIVHSTVLLLLTNGVSQFIERSFISVRVHFKINFTPKCLSCHLMSSTVTALSLFQGVTGVVAGANPSCLWAKAGYICISNSDLRWKLSLSIWYKDINVKLNAVPSLCTVNFKHHDKQNIFLNQRGTLSQTS